MSELPAGWRWSTLDEIAGGAHSNVIIGPFGSDLRTVDYRNAGVPLVFVRNIRAKDFGPGGARLSEEKAAELMAHEARRGDVLITKMGDPPGDAAVYTGDRAIITADCVRLRPANGYLSAYLAHSFGAPSVRTQVESITRGVAQRKVSLGRMRTVRIPVPPIDEQRRIVEILEDHLSRLDAGDAYLAVSARRLAVMSVAGLWQATHGLDGAVVCRLGEVADVRLGRQRSPKNHQGDRMVPYMRAANVDWNRLRLDDVKTMQFTAAESETYELRLGDILLTEASGSASEVGKSVLYRDEVPGACFQNTVLRVRCRQGNPEFVQRYLLGEARAGRFRPESRGVGIHHLGRHRLASFSIELPPLDRQDAAVEKADDVLGACERLRVELDRARRLQQQLRRALLHAAFTGRLTGHASDVERVEELAVRTG